MGLVPQPSDVIGRHGPFGPLSGYIIVTQQERERTWLGRLIAETWFVRLLSDGSSWTIDVEWSGGSDRLEEPDADADLIGDWIGYIREDFENGKPPDLEKIGHRIAADRTW